MRGSQEAAQRSGVGTEGNQKGGLLMFGENAAAGLGPDAKVGGRGGVQGLRRTERAERTPVVARSALDRKRALLCCYRRNGGEICGLVGK